jgi:hypothetical protein
MQTDTIDAAIVAHRGWVSRFRTAFQGINTEQFALNEILDATSCDLGIWLASDSSELALDSLAHHEIEKLHGQFHQLCGQLAQAINERTAMRNGASMLAELDRLSKQIVSLLLTARRS